MTAADPTALEATRPQLDDQLRCARCDAAVTIESQATEQSGAHEHTFRNPAGYSWTIVCYRDAPGCTSVGELTSDASWFTGYEWAFANCATCGRHLGWWFVGEGPSFVGLIVTRLLR